MELKKGMIEAINYGRRTYYQNTTNKRPYSNTSDRLKKHQNKRRKLVIDFRVVLKLMINFYNL